MSLDGTDMPRFILFLTCIRQIYIANCVLWYVFTTPALEDCKEFRFGWINQLFWRNQLMLWLFAGGWHLMLFQVKTEGKDGMDKKYEKKWPRYDRKFLFGHQTYENVIFSCTSGVLIWTAYEAVFMKLWATNRISFYLDVTEYPLWTVAQFILIPFWREFHFYWTHRMIHWKPLYKHIHYLHHKNVNPGPWSGLSMHPIEHLFYFSVVIPHMFVFGHPLHLFFNAQHTALTPSQGHTGFEGAVMNGKVPQGSYFHYLHHRYFECNYGEASIPLDRWFGTFRDGLEDGEGSKTATKGGEKRAKEPAWITSLTVSVGMLLGAVPLVPFISAAL